MAPLSGILKMQLFTKSEKMLDFLVFIHYYFPIV